MAPRNFLTDFELMIVLAALRGGDEAYAVQIAREIESTARRPVQLGAVYTALNRLATRSGLSRVKHSGHSRLRSNRR